jgi:hypothetical protein
MPDLALDAIELFRDSAWGAIAVVVAILVLILGLFARTIRHSRTSDLTREELRLLKAFSEQAEGNPWAYLSVELAAYRAGVDKYETKVRRLKALGYLQDSNIKEGYLGHRRVWITPKGVQRAQKRR